MRSLRKKIYAAAGYNTTYFGPGRQEFDPSKPFPPFESYLQETAKGTCSQIRNPVFDEGVIGSFMSGCFLKQANLPAFLPYMVPSLFEKPCMGVEGACGTGGKAIVAAVRGILSDLADSVFASGFEMQNTMKSVYGADVLAGAAHYSKQRKQGHAYFFSALFAERAAAYYEKYGYDMARRGMAKWYEQAILNARKNPKAQEFHNTSKNLFSLGMTPPDPETFVPYLNHYDCSKVSDGASSVGIFSEQGLASHGIRREEAVEIVGIGEAQGDITLPPRDLTSLSTTASAVQKALQMADLSIQQVGLLELHDCFTISGLLSLEALNIVEKGKAADFVLNGNTSSTGQFPTNLSGGLGGFGHPTGASGVRQMVDLVLQLTGKAANQANLRSPYGLMVSMGGDDKTVTCIIVYGHKDAMGCTFNTEA
jgi:acetyl-CoA C-acetyltransferase